jgi:DNA polymerase elongation subunit (family B)
MSLNIKFQILDINYYDEIDDVEDDFDPTKNYVIRLFGMTDSEKPKTIYIKVENFQPYFFIELDEIWGEIKASVIINTIKLKVYPKNCIGGLIDYQVVNFCKFTEFTNYTPNKFLKLIFTDYDSMKAYIRALNKKIIIDFIQVEPIKFSLYEANIEPYLRFLHIKDIEACGWAQIKEGDYELIGKETSCNINISVNWNNINKYECNDIRPFLIASFDIECTSEDGAFPQAWRKDDKIIQIGTTFSRYGSADCFYKHMITLGTCANIENVDVESYEKEEDVLLAWMKLIQRMDPDIITGYNIFGFDFPYIRKRSEFLDIAEEFSLLSRPIGEESHYVKDKKLASSALGENKLSFYEMTGRVLIDIYKNVQKDYKLASYKLDDVASNFIRGDIIRIENNDKNGILITDNIIGLKENDYIMILYNDGVLDNKHMRGTKFLVEQIISFEEEKINKKKKIKETVIYYKLIVNKNIDTDILEKKYKIYWGQAKDDITPNQMFELQKGTANDRAIIGKYCIKDCSLCNILMERLQIVTNNVGMGNVCHVPLSFLFMRGQGIKIYSLVAKKCREKGHLIKTIKKKSIPKEVILNIIKSEKKEIVQTLIDKSDKTKKKKIVSEIICTKLNGLKELDTISILIGGEEIQKCIINKIVNKNNKYGITVEEDLNYKLKDQYVTISKYDKKLSDKQENEKAFKEFVDELCYREKYENSEVKEDFKFSGAVVFEPVTGIHLQPITVLDFASLYPSAIIYKNLSHETHVKDVKKYGNLEGYGYNKIIYSTAEIEHHIGEKDDIIEGYKKAKFIVVETKEIINKKKYKVVLAYDKEKLPENLISKIIIDKDKISIMQYQTSIFAYKLDGSKAIIPETLQDILDARIIIKKIMENEKDKFKKAILDGRQLALKITANSLYGQTGASTSAIYKREIAASTTATGRQMLEFSKRFIEEYFGTMINYAINDKEQFLNFFKNTIKVLTFCKKAQIIKLAKGSYIDINDFMEKFYCKVKELDDLISVNPKIIYGDTDSTFCDLRAVCIEIEEKDKRKIEISIKLGVLASKTINIFLPLSLSQEYEKVLFPFILLTKKRYVGNLYEYDPNEFKQKSMGIVLKRRDNAPIVKIIVGGLIDQILNKHNPKGGVEFVEQCLKDILLGKFELDKFIITKSLKSTYKNPMSQIHCVVANKMSERDPGNKPKANDRISYAFIQLESNKKIKYKGERAEDEKYILEKNLKIDHLTYILDQIMKPTLQFLGLIIKKPEDLFNKYIIKERNKVNKIKNIEHYANK